MIDMPGGARRAQHRHHQRVLEANAKDPRHLAARRVENRIPFSVDLDGEAAHDWHRQTGAHDRRLLITKSIDALQLAFSANSAEPRHHDLLAAYSKQTLLIDETAAITRLLHAQLQLQNTA